ncbi:PREDICTED: HAUS augmin-like complex subunit 3 [Vollenhovia emeryi]|uniref:HAUS augmin-like complex subunit 3 n=1 Tax=Vollenhovia emeryi TaxID=411798 RepID=UPI0005F47849|nr:PREDICTED: HAUS augmin-like complex subunit 3 [Vollenhovia emeryi]
MSRKTSVTGKVLYNKICELRPDLSSGTTSDILSKVCNDPSTQPFLEWFCKNVSSANILSREEMELKNTLENAGEQLKGEALDAALEEATKDCPDLLKLVSLDDTCQEDLFAEYEALKESCRKDEEYLQSLKQGIKVLKEVENKLDDDIEEEEAMLNKEQIELEKTYEDCSVVLKEFDDANCQFSKDIECLLNVYANAAKNQGKAVLWSQMPIDSFMKQIELYVRSLGIHIKKQFGTGATKDKQEEDSNYVSLMSDSRDKQMDEKLHELSLCETNLTSSKVDEINAGAEEKSYMAMLECAQDIYNGGVLKVPGSSKLQDEIQTLTIQRDSLEQNVELLRDQQLSVAAQYAEMEIIKILKNDTLARLERRKARLERLKNLHSLVGKHGHVHVDLLCMLMEMQFRCLRDVAEFIADTRHYLTTEYELSSTRCEVLQQKQDEYATLVNVQSPKTCNVFNQLFMSMMLGDDNSDKSQLSAALKRYDDLIADNAEKKKLMLETYLTDKIDKLRELKSEVDKDYTAETRTGPTISLKPASYEISTKFEEISATVQEVQGDITKMRSRLKERMRMDVNLEREKDILWQRFLVEPDTLRMKYEQAEQRANESHFGDAVESKPSEAN